MAKRWLLALLSLPALSLPAWAQAPEHPLQTARRFGLEAGAGLSTTLPYLHARLNYRLPTADHRWDVFLDQTFLTVTPVGANFAQTTLIGAKYYFWESRPFMAFGALGGGLSYSGGVAGVAPVGILGVGGDWMFADAFGVSLGLYGSYPVSFRPELNLKVLF